MTKLTVIEIPDPVLYQKAEEVKGSISRKESSINYADKQIQDNLKTIENTKNGIEIQQGKICTACKTAFKALPHIKKLRKGFSFRWRNMRRW
jgi:hypothetical protein